ncbi:MAG TPA: protein translocase subunit SecF [Pyrinomonadaceae bacterium]|nr:protein translocase subunit SecF [Pyrinomonadaceae bacterium]
MIQLFNNVNVDWLGRRKIFMGLSILLMLAGLASAIVRQAAPGGSDAFNLGVDFKGGTVVTAKFLKQRPTDEQLRAEFAKQGLGDAVIQPTDKAEEVLIKVPRQGAGDSTVNAEEVQAQVDAGSAKVKKALDTFGPEKDAYDIIGKDAVGEVAGRQLRTQAIAVTLLALVGMLLYIAIRYEWTYGAAAVITVFHDVLVTLGFFSIFQWEVSLTVIAALLTLVGFSVNDTIVTFDRVRENLKLHRRDSLYKITNDAINQTLSRTVITSGLVFLSVLAMVLFGGEVLRGFSLALFIGIIIGTYSTIAIASPIMVWWQQRIDASKTRTAPPSASGGRGATGQQAARARKAKAAGGGGVVNQPQGAARS